MIQAHWRLNWGLVDNKMSWSGETLRVINRCELLEIGQVVYCVTDCPETQTFMIWSDRLIYGVNHIKFTYERRKCFKVI